MVKTALKLPQYQLIKQYLKHQIESGEWPLGYRTPSENKLAKQFSVSRMTARRALQELSDQGLLSRTAGSGTFVARPESQAASFEIIDLVARAQQAGYYSNRLLGIETVVASRQMAELMLLDSKQPAYQLTMLHLERNRPLLLQQLWVNTALAPALPKQSFNKITPDAYLDWFASSTSVDYQLMAVMPSQAQRHQLALQDQPSPVCMQLNRRCWRQRQVVSISASVIPAAFYQLGHHLL
jgi:GntR family histidine utilization transcriptional repressor